jgi:vancomycin resistance protein YoaR
MPFSSFKSFLKFKNPKNVTKIVFLIWSLLLLLFVFSVIVSTSYDKTYRGIKINNIKAGNYSKSELYNILENKFKKNLSNNFLTIKVEDFEKVTDFKHLEVKYDLNKIVDDAFAIGRSDNIIINTLNILKAGILGTDVNVKLTFNKKIVQDLLDNVISKVSTPIKEASIREDSSKIYLLSGKSGINIIKKTELKKIYTALGSGKSSVVSLHLEKIAPKKIYIDKFYKLLNTEPKNSTINIIKNREYTITPEIVGKKIKKDTLIKYIKKLTTSGDDEIELPVILKTPQITKSDLEKNLFKDTLSTFDTVYPTYSQEKLDRAQNIKIAVSKINNTIVKPGGIFSFNDIVGNRTSADGYKEATTFQNGEMVQSVGGGICQVSTTLHNAVLLADFKIVERQNHIFKVGYISVGMDAAVSYGSLDYRFQNTSKWPIKISGITTNSNQIVFNIFGTNEEPNKILNYYTQTVKTIPFTTKYKDDPTLKDGQIRITANGFDGLVVNTFKKITINGIIKSNKLLYTSHYNAYDTKALKGTKKSITIANPTNTVNPTPSISPLGTLTIKPSASSTSVVID